MSFWHAATPHSVCVIVLSRLAFCVFFVSLFIFLWALSERPHGHLFFLSFYTFLWALSERPHVMFLSRLRLRPVLSRLVRLVLSVFVPPPWVSPQVVRRGIP